MERAEGEGCIHYEPRLCIESCIAAEMNEGDGRVSPRRHAGPVSRAELPHRCIVTMVGLMSHGDHHSRSSGLTGWGSGMMLLRSTSRGSAFLMSARGVFACGVLASEDLISEGTTLGDALHKATQGHKATRRSTAHPPKASSGFGPV